MPYYPLHTLPSPLDVVWCRFPLAESPRSPGPKKRPALVRAVQFNKSATKGAVEIAYGTSKLRKSEYPFHLIIQNFASLDAAGLPCATRFDLGRTIRLPWHDSFFVPREGYTTPVIGNLDESSRMQLEALKVAARIHHKKPSR